MVHVPNEKAKTVI